MIRYTDREHAALLHMAERNIPIRVQARVLRRQPGAICQKRRRLAARGDLVLRQRPPWRSWTRAEEWQLEWYLEQGWSYDRIARRLRRTRTSILLKCQRRGVRLTTIPGTYSARDVQHLLGLGCAKIVSRWIRLGWLRAGNAGTDARPLWRVQQSDLWEFLEDDRFWMCWSPDRITDADLCAWATDLRAGRPPWLSIGEAARRRNVTISTVNQWIHKGLIPATRYGNWWIRDDALEDFVIPSDRPRTETEV